MSNDFENQLDKIRVDLYERAKSMTNVEAVRITNENARKIAQQHGIKIVRGDIAPVDKNTHAV